jgi:hypothetical protein
MRGWGPMHQTWHAAVSRLSLLLHDVAYTAAVQVNEVCMNK